MKKILILLILSILISPLFASNGDTLNIGGVVPLVLTLVVGPIVPYDNLDLSGASGAIIVPIADIDITTNNTAGWELWITSTNSDAGNQALVNDDGDTVDYTLTYGGTTGITSAVTATTGNKFGEADAGATRYLESSTLSINYDQDTTYPAGYYSDQLTIVVRAK